VRIEKVPSKVLRSVAHIVGATPFVVAAIRLIHSGWRPIGDDSAIAIRSWDVLSTHPPLLGQLTVIPGLFELGPMEFGLLAIPVHLDPRFGLVWGAALWCVIATVIAIEAAWTVSGAAAGFVMAAFILANVIWNPTIATSAAWNPNLGDVFFMAALGCAYAVLSGHRNWWPVLVATASLAADCHLMFALIGAVLVATALVVALIDRRRQEGSYRWLVAGAVVTGACWTAPLINEVTGHPGNLTRLFDSQSGSLARMGWGFGLRTLSSSVVPPPLWLTPSNRLIFVKQVVGGINSHSRLAGLAVLMAAGILLLLGLLLRSRRLSALATVSVVACGGLVATFANVPRGKDLVSLRYLALLVTPVGVLFLLTACAATVVVGRRVLVHSTRRPEWRYLAALAAAPTVALMVWSLSSQAALLSTPQHPVAWVNIVRAAVGKIERTLPRRQPVQIVLEGKGVQAYSLTLGISWELKSAGYQPEPGPGLARELTAMLGPEYRPQEGVAVADVIVGTNFKPFIHVAGGKRPRQ
jgi:hypothetical protein